MQKRKNKSLSLIRTVISCTIFVVSIAALVSVHLHIFLYSKVPIFSDPTTYKLPTQHGKELSWTQEFTPPQFSKLPPPSQKLNVANRNRDVEKLWKAPQNKDFVPCVDPSPEYSPPTESRGYLLVHTNGGLNQMRAGICDMVAVARIINATLVVPELDKRSFWQDTRSAVTLKMV